METVNEGLNNVISNVISYVNKQEELLSNGKTENASAYIQLLLNLMSFIVNIGNGEQEVTSLKFRITLYLWNILETISKNDSILQLFAENLLQVHKHLTSIKEEFNGDQLHISLLDKMFDAVINHRINSKFPCRSPELLARYCDGLLKKTLKSNTESEIDDKLSDCITIFKYIDNKERFQQFYAKMFTKRLLHSQWISMDAEECVSMDAEEDMINKLKQECGTDFTSKLKGMLKDIKLSKELMLELRYISIM